MAAIYMDGKALAAKVKEDVYKRQSISSSSTWRRPAVSRNTMSFPCSLA